MGSVKSGEKGFDLEEALKTYFWQAGYFAVRAVPYRLDGEDVTDIDLWLYERPAAFTRRRLIVDAKNRKSPKASERIIWVKGLQAALGVEGAIVATTDTRPSTRLLSKALNVTLLDGDAVAKLTQSEQLKNAGQMRSEDFDGAVKRIDDSRHSRQWRENLLEARASLISGMGVHSTNRNLSASGFFAEQALLAHPHSEQAQVALRLFYLTSALAAISLDYVLADQAFRSAEDRRKSIIASIRFGQPNADAAPPLVRAAIELARKYADNGGPVAKQIEYGFYNDSGRIPAEIIAEYVARVSTKDALFNVAREIERASSSIQLSSYDQLSLEARSLLGVIMDFNGISREKIATAWPGDLQSSSKGSLSGNAAEAGPLFQSPKPAADTRVPSGTHQNDT
jgi:Restriction endonuclease